MSGIKNRHKSVGNSNTFNFIQTNVTLIIFFNWKNCGKGLNLLVPFRLMCE